MLFLFVAPPTFPGPVENRKQENMDAQIDPIEIPDPQLQERVVVVIEDRGRAAEQILDEQAAEHTAGENISTPRFLP